MTSLFPTDNESAEPTEPAQRFVIAQSWWIASELARRHPEYVVHEMHPGGGSYDCLALLIVGQHPAVQLNRGGTIHVMDNPAYRRYWRDALASGTPHALVKEIEAAASLNLARKAPATTSRTLAYRFIAALMTMTVNDRHVWDARNEFIDSSSDDETVLNGYIDAFPDVRHDFTTTEPIGLWQEPYSHFWAILRDEKPVAIVSIDGRFYRKEHAMDLMPAYKAHNRAIIPLVVDAMAGLI
jgi:hypothetical protein